MIGSIRFVAFTYIALTVAMVLLQEFRGGFPIGLPIGLGVPSFLLFLSVVATAKNLEKETEYKTHHSVCTFSLFWCLVYLPIKWDKGSGAALIGTLLIWIVVGLFIPHVAYNLRDKKMLLSGSGCALPVLLLGVILVLSSGSKPSVASQEPSEVVTDTLTPPPPKPSPKPVDPKPVDEKEAELLRKLAECEKKITELNKQIKAIDARATRSLQTSNPDWDGSVRIWAEADPYKLQLVKLKDEKSLILSRLDKHRASR